jgi:tryptophan-rich sensory protein
MKFKVLNLAMFAVMVFMNYLANALPLNGKTTGQLSGEYPNLFVPAGVTFSIWGIIYIMLLAFILIQFKDEKGGLVQTIGWVFGLSCLFNALWIVAWHYEQLFFSLIMMLGLLVTLIIINFIFRDLHTSIAKVAFGIYLGWICIATIANVTALLVRFGWGGWGILPEIWTIAMIGIGSLVCILALMRLNNPFLGLAVIWAFIGIILKRQADYQSIVIAAAIAILVVLSFSLYAFIKRGIA